MNNLIIFDLDGVITSEDAYWDAAGLTLHELLYSPRYWGLSHQDQYQPASAAEESRSLSRAMYPEAAILSFKARAINSNWDTCYAAVCLHCIHLLALVPNLTDLLPFKPWDTTWIAAFRQALSALKKHMDGTEEEKNQQLLQNALGFTLPICDACIGLALINCLDSYASQLLDQPIENIFSRYSLFWPFCQDIFQEWYLGDALYTETYGHEPKQAKKPGCIHFEHPLLPVQKIKATLESLQEEGYILGFATGRLRNEAEYPLSLHGLLGYFAQHHRSTYDDVEAAETHLRAIGNQTLLSKPHPFPYLVAAHRERLPIFSDDHPRVGAGDAVTWGGRPRPLSHQDHPRVGAGDAVTWGGDPRGRPRPLSHQDGGPGEHLFAQPGANPSTANSFIVVGDSTSDILSGHAAGAITIAVLTGARTAEARHLLEQSGPDFTIEDMTHLPALLAHIDSLATIQKLQFSEREKAERLLQRWFAHHMHITPESVTLSPKATSLNSFNGIYRDHSGEYFFKTHIEEQGVLEEYYHAELLSRVGYNIVKPLRTLHEKDRQMVIYPVVSWPVMFDLMRSVETGNAQPELLAALIAAERHECERLLTMYAKTLASSSSEEHAHAPIHQLFWHRLTGGRLANFYAEKLVPLLHYPESAINFDDLTQYHWVINGMPQQHTLGELIERAKLVLNPVREALTIIGHGDAHFGNVFLEQQRTYLYFDPAFAGRHTPLLDVIKPLFHNIFATWMYFPQDVARELQLSVHIDNTNIVVEHNYSLTQARQEILQTKVQHLLTPLVAWLQAQNALPDDWQEMMRLALMCCPLLTINLLDSEHIPVPITWLGLALSVQMGNNGIEPWRKDI